MEMENNATPSPTEELKQLLPDRSAQFAWLVLAAVLAWFSWPTITHMIGIWWSQEDYQHAFFVPIFSLFLLWIRRGMILKSAGRGHAWGLAFFGLWALMRWIAVYFNYGSLPEMSLLPFFAGLALFVGGWQGLLWAWPSIVMLFFMIPLPGVAQVLFSEKLQQISTHISLFVIQTLGIPSVAQGNVIMLPDDRLLRVEEACSGLRMFMLFFAICLGAAFVTRRPLWEKLLLVGSAPLIAVLSNVFRVVLTGVCYEVAARWATVVDVQTVFDIAHKGAGYLMMPIGLLLLWLEMALLSKLFIEPMDTRLLVGTMLAGVGRESQTTSALRRRETRG
jgi:exosortase